MREGAARKMTGAAVTYSLVTSLILAGIGGAIWLEGGPHPRTRGTWLLLVVILIVSALPVLICWLLS